MKFSPTLIDLARALAVPARLARHILIFSVMAGWARAAYEGPVPKPADKFGGAGPYAVVTESVPSPDWPGHIVTVYRPDGKSGRCPTWFFAHGFGGSDPTFYLEIFNHLASHGAVVVFSPYPATAGAHPEEVYATLFDGFAAAVDQFSDQIDTTRVGIAGHSYGAGAVPAMALRAVRERGWGGNGLALLLLAPWYSYFVSDADLASFPAGTQAVVQIYEDDSVNDHRMAIDLFTHLNIPVDDKDYLMVRSDRIDGYSYSASHRVPTSGGTSAETGGSVFDALDSWGVMRIAQALTDSALNGDRAARAVALGHGSAEQTQMGATSGGRALRSMVETDAPVPLYPQSRYSFGFNRPVNPRADAVLPEPVTRPRLSNVSARARSGNGDDVLIVGAMVAGERPKSLLIRAVGPALQSFGIQNAMPDPRLATYHDGVADIEVDNWSQASDGDALRAATEEVGAFPLPAGSKDAAILASFSPGGWTFHAAPNDGAPGVALLELYDAERDASAWLHNLSARARVGTGEDLLIAGFITAGEGNLRLLIRGVGPALAALGVSDALKDPALEIYRGEERIAMNDNWSTDPTQASEIAAAGIQVGAFPLAVGSDDASLVLSLPPGAYTAHVRTQDGSTGIGLVEVYVIP